MPEIKNYKLQLITLKPGSIIPDRPTPSKQMPNGYDIQSHATSLEARRVGMTYRHSDPSSGHDMTEHEVGLGPGLSRTSHFFSKLLIPEILHC